MPLSRRLAPLAWAAVLVAVLASSTAHLSSTGSGFLPASVERTTSASVGSAPDLRPVYTTAGNGTPLHVSFWLPSATRATAPAGSASSQG